MKIVTVNYTLRVIRFNETLFPIFNQFDQYDELISFYIREISSQYVGWNYVPTGGYEVEDFCVVPLSKATSMRTWFAFCHFVMKV
jgi:hypothetical protein